MLIDFEHAIANAILDTFGNQVLVKQCFYQLCQSTWRKVQDLGLAPHHTDAEELKLFVGMIDALSFLSLDDVTDDIHMEPASCNAPW